VDRIGPQEEMDPRNYTKKNQMKNEKWKTTNGK
jgi:hypothetical protein